MSKFYVVLSMLFALRAAEALHIMAKDISVIEEKKMILYLRFRKGLRYERNNTVITTLPLIVEKILFSNDDFDVFALWRNVPYEYSKYHALFFDGLFSLFNFIEEKTSTTFTDEKRHVFPPVSYAALRRRLQKAFPDMNTKTHQFRRTGIKLIFSFTESAEQAESSGRHNPNSASAFLYRTVGKIADFEKWNKFFTLHKDTNLSSISVNK